MGPSRRGCYQAPSTRSKMVRQTNLFACVFGLHKQVIERDSLEQSQAQVLHSCVDTELGLQLFPDDRTEHIDRKGDPQLGLDGIFQMAEKWLYPQVLLDPLEEQLYMPAAPVQVGDDQWRKLYIVDQEHQILVVVGIPIEDST